MYLQIRRYTSNVYLQFFEKIMCICSFVYLQFWDFFMCVSSVFPSINLDFMSRNTSEMKGNWNKWWKITFGGACGALKRKYKGKQDSGRLFLPKIIWCVSAVFGENYVYLQFCVSAVLKSGYTHWFRISDSISRKSELK